MRWVCICVTLRILWVIRAYVTPGSVGSQMTMMLLALRGGRALQPGRILVLISFEARAGKPEAV
jgi:hypothetical protein